MPRRGRLHIDGGCYHIMGRGLERRYIFASDADKTDFLIRLEHALSKTSTVCMAWAVMSNHYHLLLRVGTQPVGILMSGILGGYASQYNRRHQRVGYVFQNRFASILCEEEAYFLELIRYIHLNPVRAGVVVGISALDTYRWAGHAAVMGTMKCGWQRTSEVLDRFGRSISESRRRYREFIAEGLSTDDRVDFDGGGWIRSAGGWEALTNARRDHEQRIGDERILGSSDFVQAVLRNDSLSVDPPTGYQRSGVTLTTLISMVFSYFDLDVDLVGDRGRGDELSSARSVICYLGTSELGLSQSQIGTVLKLSQAGVSMARHRGREYCETERLTIDRLVANETN